MTTSIQSFVHEPHTVISKEETFILRLSSNSKAFASELLENPEVGFIGTTCMVICLQSMIKSSTTS